MPETLTAPEERMWVVLSKTRDEDETPHLADCQMIVGDSILEFKNGRSVAPESLVPLVLADPRVEVPGFNGEASAPAPTHPDETRKERLERELAEEEAAEESGPPSEDEDEDEGLTEEERQALLDEQLAEDNAVLGRGQRGATKPDAEDESPSTVGKKSKTADGRRRCQAVKSDGSQCENPASEESACGLSAHQSQLA